MRKRFDQQLETGTLLIEHTPTIKSRDAMASLIIALRELYKYHEYRDQILDIVEKKITEGAQPAGRSGMHLWTLFVLAQTRLSKQLSYDELHLQANYNKLLRQVMGVEKESGFEAVSFSYQTIVDNVSLLDDVTLKQINEVIVSFGQGEVFKKKRGGSLTIKDR
jgi:hypothetical protein